MQATTTIMAVSASFTALLLITTSLLLCSSEADTSPQLVNGLSWDFHKTSCPKLESIVRKQLKKVFKDDIGQAAGLLRLHFHDCFVQGCDGSVLLDGSASGPGESEKSAPPNLSLRAAAFKIIDDLRERVHKQCGRVVSCADITTLAARDAVYLSGGPDYDIPLGRRDGLTFATRNATLANLPPPTANTSTLLTSLATKNLDPTDVVALSGGHTIGISHCTSFTMRLYPTQDSSMDKTFANNLKGVCPTLNSTNTTNLDIRTPNQFDNKYYVDLMNRQGLFTSDQDLYTDKRTRDIVKSFAVNETLFFEKFVFSMIKMGQLSVLTGTTGEIRANCSVRNPDNSYLESVVGNVSETRLEKQLKSRWALEELIDEQLNRYHAHYNRAMVPTRIKDVSHLLMPKWAPPHELASLSWMGDWRPSAILHLLRALTHSWSSLSSSFSDSIGVERILSQVTHEIRIEEAVIDEEMAEIQATCVLHLPFAPVKKQLGLGSAAALACVQSEFKKIERVITKAQQLRFKALELVVKKVLGQTDAAEFLVSFAGIHDTIHQFAAHQRFRKGSVSLPVKALWCN